MQAGEAIYVDTCSACHMRSGAGVERMFPRLAGNDGPPRPTRHA